MLNQGFNSEDTNDPIRKFQSDLREASDTAERLRPIVKSCQEAIQRSGLEKTSVLVRVEGLLRPKVYISIFCEKLDETIPLFRELAKEGLKTNKENTHKDHNMCDAFAMREYNLGPDLTVTAMLLSNPSGSGESCRMEQVGVKEVPIYELKCDGAA